MQQIISSAAVRRCEQANFDAKLATPEGLMKIAGDNCTGEFLKFATQYLYKRIVIFAGKGNNGGDGVVIAGNLAAMQDVPVVLALAADASELSSCSKYFFEQLDRRVCVTAAGEIELQNSDIVIDALLGTGCHSPMREPYRSLINKINEANLPVFAVDLPSGLGSDLCVRADFTATIGFFKTELFQAAGIENCGNLRRVELPLTLPPESSEPTIYAADLAWFKAMRQRLLRQIHKYQRGSVVIAGGSQEYYNAVFLSGRAALRNGAGMVYLALPFAITPHCGTLSLIAQQMPSEDGSLCEKSFAAMENILKKASILAIGPGMGRKNAAGDFVRQALACDLPLIIDADAIWHTANHIELLRQRRNTTVLTPHRGEAATLAKACNIQIDEDDVTFARQLAGATGAVILLKGARTVIADPDGSIWRNTSGSPALATAGSGDVLTGLIAAMIAGSGSANIPETVLQAAFLHGLAGEMGALKWGESGVTADDLPELAAQARCRIYNNRDIF